MIYIFPGNAAYSGNSNSPKFNFASVIPGADDNSETGTYDAGDIRLTEPPLK